MNSDHHWVDGATLVPDPSQYFGFMYQIHELDTGRLYVGIKQYWFSSGKSKRRCMDKQSEKWTPHHWKESDWRSYTGSSKKLNQEIKSKGLENYEFSIIGQYPCSRSLRYAEANYLHKVDALTLKNDEGEYVYYNESIQDIKFRPPESKSAESIAKSIANRNMDSIAKKIRESSPSSCKKCGKTDWGTMTVKGSKTRYCRACKVEQQRKRRAKQRENAR